jgi:hypothetical protein
LAGNLVTIGSSLFPARYSSATAFMRSRWCMELAWLALYRRGPPGNSSSLVFLFFLLSPPSFRFFDLFPFLQTWDFLGPKPHGLALVGGYGVEPAVVGGFPKKFLFCFSVFLSSLPRRFVIRLVLAARASLPALPTPTLVALGTVRVFISRDRVSRSVPVAPSYKRSSLQHSRSLPMSAGYPMPHSG